MIANRFIPTGTDATPKKPLCRGATIVRRHGQIAVLRGQKGDIVAMPWYSPLYRGAVRRHHAELPGIYRSREGEPLVRVMTDDIEATTPHCERTKRANETRETE